jgi:hypothetical protein
VHNAIHDILMPTVPFSMRRANTKNPGFTPGFLIIFPLASFAFLPYILKLYICQYDCIHAESLHPHIHLPACPEPVEGVHMHVYAT